jgi:acyl carrier protein
VASLILEILDQVAEDLDLSNVDPDLSLREQLGLDSVDFLDFVMVLRTRYGIDVPEEDYYELMTLNSSVAYLGPRFEKSGSSQPGES